MAKDLATVSGPRGKNESVSVDVRKIDNGYITRSSRYSDGNYESKEVYSEERPNLEAELTAPTDAGQVAGKSSMTRAKSVLERGR